MAPKRQLRQRRALIIEPEVRAANLNVKPSLQHLAYCSLVTRIRHTVRVGQFRRLRPFKKVIKGALKAIKNGTEDRLTD